MLSSIIRSSSGTATMQQKLIRVNRVDESMSIALWLFNGLLAAGAWAMAYTGLPLETAGILVTLMIIDFFTGISSAVSCGEKITSHRMKIGALSKISALTIPLVMALAAKGLGADFMWLVNWSMSVFILSETYSIISNIYTIRTGKKAPEWDAVSMILRRIRELIDTIDKRG